MLIYSLFRSTGYFRYFLNFLLFVSNSISDLITPYILTSAFSFPRFVFVFPLCNSTSFVAGLIIPLSTQLVCVVFVSGIRREGGGEGCVLNSGVRCRETNPLRTMTLTRADSSHWCLNNSRPVFVAKTEFC